MSVNEKMTAIANEVRTLSGVSDKLGLDEMASHTKDANTEVDTQKDLIHQIAEALQGKAAVGEAKPVVEPLEVTENGTYTAPDGVDGYSPVTVNVVSGGGNEFEALLTNKLTELNSDVSSIRQYSFRGATALTSVNLPKATKIETNAFYGCTKLASVNMPLVKSIAGDAFNSCSVLPHIVLPSLTSGAGYMFRYCYLLKTIDLPVIANIVANMFTDCRRLTAIILRSPTMCTLENTSAFTNCYHITGTTNGTYNPNGDKDCYIYVPSALVDSYKSATNWSNYASQIRAIEDYPDITGGIA